LHKLTEFVNLPHSVPKTETGNHHFACAVTKSDVDLDIDCIRHS